MRPTLQAFMGTGFSESPSFHDFVSTLKALSTNNGDNLVSDWQELRYFDPFGLTAAEIVIQERLADIKIKYENVGGMILAKIPLAQKSIAVNQYHFFANESVINGKVGKTVISPARIQCSQTNSPDALAASLWDDVISAAAKNPDPQTIESNESVSSKEVSKSDENLNSAATAESAVRIFRELFQNSIEHAGNQSNFIYRRGQFFKAHNRVQITIGNNRDTFFGRLRASARYKEDFFKPEEGKNNAETLDMQAAAFAMFPGLSRKAFSTPRKVESKFKFDQGVGLYILSELARACGSMIIFSGESSIICRSSTEPIIIRKLPFLFPGTLIGLSLDVKKLSFFTEIVDNAVYKAAQFWNHDKNGIRDVNIKASESPTYYSDLLLSFNKFKTS